MGTYFHEETKVKLSNDKWTLLVYKDLQPIKDTISQNDKILENLLNTIEEDTPRMMSFKSQVQTHVSLLTQISNAVNLKYTEIMADTRQYAFRSKRGIFNGIGTVWKSITGNLDASDGEYFNECITKITRDEYQIENLLKNQISVTTSVIKSFNATIQKLQIDEETFNNDIKEIRESILDISDELKFFSSQIAVLNICESLMESYSFIEDALNDIVNSITFARLKMLHSSIITPSDLIESLKRISQALQKNNLPLPIYSSYIAQYIDIIELQAYQTDTRIVFVLNIPLVDPETYTLYRIFPIPIADNRTGFHHILTTTNKYIARNDDSLLYTTVKSLEDCKFLQANTRICPNALPYPIDNDAVCEAQLLKQQDRLPRTCQNSVVLAKDYNVQKLKTNLWLIAVADQLPISIKCGSRDMVTQIINTNSILKLQPECNAFIGSTRVHAQKIIDVYNNVTYNSHPVQIPFSCCDHYPEKIHLPDLKPIRLNKINTEDLDIAQHKLSQYSDELDRLINQPFVTKHLSWFTILTIVLIVALIALYIFCKCKRRRTRKIGIVQVSNDDHPPPPPQASLSKTLRHILPKRRPSIRIGEPIEEEEGIELNLNKMKM